MCTYHIYVYIAFLHTGTNTTLLVNYEKKVFTQSCTMFGITWTVAFGLSVTWHSPGKNPEMGCHFSLLQDLPRPGIKPRCSVLRGKFFTVWVMLQYKIKIWHWPHSSAGAAFNPDQGTRSHIPPTEIKDPVSYN